MNFGIEPNYLNQVLSQWLEEVRVVRTRRTPVSVRLKRKRYYRKKRSAIKRKQKVGRRKASSKRKAKRRRILRKRMRIKPGSRKRIRLATAQELSGGLMEAKQAVNAVQLIEAFETAKSLANELILIESRLKQIKAPAEKLVTEWSLPEVIVERHSLNEDIDEILGVTKDKSARYDSPEAILDDCKYMIESLGTYAVDLDEAQGILVMMTEWLDKASESLATEAKENPRIYFDKDLTKTEAKKITDALEAELNIEAAMVVDRSSVELVGGRPVADDIRQAVDSAKVRNKIQHISDVKGESVQEAKSAVRVYDNGGKTIDRYTVVVDNGGHKDFYGLAKDPSAFNQFLGQDSDGFREGDHLGQLVSVDSLDPKTKEAALSRAGGLDEAKLSRDSLVASYIETALWSSGGVKPDGTELENLDDEYSIDDMAPEALQRAQKDIDAFIAKAGNLLNGLDMDLVVHDFWLTRNRHGAGFWDGDYPKEIGEKLTDLSKQFGEIDFVIGDDGKLYMEGGKEMIEAAITEAKLKLWKRSDNYSGEDLSDYYVGPSKSRDSDILEQSNYDSALERLGGDDDEKVKAGRFGHWAVGWVEQIFVHKDAKDKVAILQKIYDDLENYPVLDDDDFYQRERQELDDTFESNKEEFVSSLAKAAGKEDLKPDEEKALEEVAKIVLDWANGYYGLQDAWVNPVDMKKNFGEHDWKDLEFNVKHPIVAELKAALTGKKEAVEAAPAPAEAKPAQPARAGKRAFEVVNMKGKKLGIHPTEDAAWQAVFEIGGDPAEYQVIEIMK